MIDPLLAVSPVDGRYRDLTSKLSEFFSEYALIKYRVVIEVRYLKFLIERGIVKLPEKDDVLNSLDKIVERFTVEEARRVKEFEEATGHDVEAVVRYLKFRLSELGLEQLAPYVHIGLTSEDVTNLAQSLSLKSFNEFLLGELKDFLRLLSELARVERKTAMLARTHGQPAVPTTLGKELAVHAYRLLKSYESLSNFTFPGKLSGAVGTYAALIEVLGKDAQQFSEKFVKSLGLEPWLATKQILPHDTISRYLSELALLSMSLVDLARDLWLLSMLGYAERVKVDRVGSSTMPHKVNPVELENAEGNLELASFLYGFLSNRLMVSRLQRDLSDSTLKRNYGSAAAYMLIGVSNLKRFLSNVRFNGELMRRDLETHPEAISELVQVRLRLKGVDALDKVRAIRASGERYREELTELVKSLGIDPKSVVPSSYEEYLGLSEEIAEEVYRLVREKIGDGP